MNIRKVIVWVICVMVLLGLVGCNKSMVNDAHQEKPGDYISKEDVTADAESIAALPENRKLIQTVNMQVETENLDVVLQQIDGRVAELGGYAESSNVQNGSAYSGKRYRNAKITVRVPADKLDSFIDKVGEISNIVSSQKTVEDVTLNYVATESRMKALQAEQTRLLELMSKAETMEDLLAVEKRLTEVRTELEQVTSALRVFDNKVDFATIALSIEEVTEFTDTARQENIWQRIGTGFVKSLKGVGNFFKELFVFIVVSIPYLALIALIGFVVVYIVRHTRGRKRKKLAQEEQKDKTEHQL